MKSVESHKPLLNVTVPQSCQKHPYFESADLPAKERVSGNLGVDFYLTENRTTHISGQFKVH